MDWLSYISQINWLAVLLAFIASMAIGFVWYMPAVLGKRWMAAIGKTEEDLKNIEVPVLVAHGTDDQIVPYPDSAPLSVKLLKQGTLKSYEGLPHGMLSTHPEIVNPDILAFLKT